MGLLSVRVTMAADLARRWHPGCRQVSQQHIRSLRDRRGGAPLTAPRGRFRAPAPVRPRAGAWTCTQPFVRSAIFVGRIDELSHEGFDGIMTHPSAKPSITVTRRPLTVLEREAPRPSGGLPCGHRGGGSNDEGGRLEWQFGRCILYLAGPRATGVYYQGRVRARPEWCVTKTRQVLQLY